MKRKISFIEWFYLIPIAFSLCLFGNVFLSLFFDISDNPVSIEIGEMIANGDMIYALVSVVIIAPLLEELIFRGLIYYIVKRFINPLFAIFISALLFAVAHMNLVQGIYAFIAGLVFGYIRYRYDTIFATLIMHFFMNICAFIIDAELIITSDIRYKIFIIFISIAIFTLSILRINVIKEKK